MTKSKQDKIASTATTDLTHRSRIGHWTRIAVMCLSGGFIYPNMMTEYDDVIKHNTDNEAKTIKE